MNMAEELATSLSCQRHGIRARRKIQGQDAQVLGGGQQRGLGRAHGGDHVPALGEEVARGFKAVAGGAASDQDGFDGYSRQ